VDKTELVNFIKYTNSNEGITREILLFTENNDANEVKDFFTLLRQAGLNSTAMAYNTLVALIDKGREDFIRAICASAYENDFLSGVYYSVLGLLDLKSFKLESGEALLRKGTRLCWETSKEYPVEWIPEMGFNMQNVFLLEGVTRPSFSRYPEPPFKILYQNIYEDSPYTCCVVCDFVYFYHYAEEFIKKFQEVCGGVNIFLLVVNPNKNIISRLKNYEGITVAETRYKDKWIAEFSASARFILANEIMEKTGGPTIFLDIDSKIPEGSDAILSALSRQKLAVCDTGAWHPWSKISAAILCAHPSEEVYEFFEAVKGYILEDLTREGPLWGLDQVALYRAVCIGRDRGWDITDINKFLGGDIQMPAFFVKDSGVIPLENRRAKRTNNYYSVRDITEDGRLVIKRDDAI
jgi:hypothetical protein